MTRWYCVDKVNTIKLIWLKFTFQNKSTTRTKKQKFPTACHSKYIEWETWIKCNSVEVRKGKKRQFRTAFSRLITATSVPTVPAFLTGCSWDGLCVGWGGQTGHVSGGWNGRQRGWEQVTENSELIQICSVALSLLLLPMKHGGWKKGECD